MGCGASKSIQVHEPKFITVSADGNATGQPQTGNPPVSFNDRWGMILDSAAGPALNTPVMDNLWSKKQDCLTSGCLRHFCTELGLISQDLQGGMMSYSLLAFKSRITAQTLSAAMELPPHQHGSNPLLLRFMHSVSSPVVSQPHSASSPPSPNGKDSTSLRPRMDFRSLMFCHCLFKDTLSVAEKMKFWFEVMSASSSDDPSSSYPPAHVTLDVASSFLRDTLLSKCSGIEASFSNGAPSKVMARVQRILVDFSLDRTPTMSFQVFCRLCTNCHPPFGSVLVDLFNRLQKVLKVQRGSKPVTERAKLKIKAHFYNRTKELKLLEKKVNQRELSSVKPFQHEFEGSAPQASSRQQQNAANRKALKDVTNSSVGCNSGGGGKEEEGRGMAGEKKKGKIDFEIQAFDKSLDYVGAVERGSDSPVKTPSPPARTTLMPYSSPSSLPSPSAKEAGWAAKEAAPPAQGSRPQGIGWVQIGARWGVGDWERSSSDEGGESAGSPSSTPGSASREFHGFESPKMPRTRHASHALCGDIIGLAPKDAEKALQQLHAVSFDRAHTFAGCQPRQLPAGPGRAELNMQSKLGLS